LIVFIFCTITFTWVFYFFPILSPPRRSTITLSSFFYFMLFDGAGPLALTSLSLFIIQNPLFFSRCRFLVEKSVTPFFRPSFVFLYSLPLPKVFMQSLRILVPRFPRPNINLFALKVWHNPIKPRLSTFSHPPSRRSWISPFRVFPPADCRPPCPRYNPPWFTSRLRFFVLLCPLPPILQVKTRNIFAVFYFPCLNTNAGRISRCSPPFSVPSLFFVPRSIMFYSLLALLFFWGVGWGPGVR